MDTLMSGYRALDLTDDQGSLCGKILATMGVEVIKVEKPGGDASRTIPPFLQDIPNPEKSLNWFNCNTNKRSITLNLDTNEGRNLFLKLVEKADFVLEAFKPGYLNNLGIGYESLSQINPRIIMTSITPFGQKGPYSHFKGCELVNSAMSGILDDNGDSDRAPVKEALESVCYQANADAALGTLIAHYYREISGIGQQVDVSIQECGTSRNTDNILIWQFDKRLVSRNGPISMLGTIHSRWIWECKDGYLYWYLVGGQFGGPANKAISDWINEEGIENPLRDVVNWNEFDRAALSQEKSDAFEEAISKLFLKHTKKEIHKEGLKRGLNACPIDTPAELFNNQHLMDRNFWADIYHPGIDTTLQYPKYFFLCSETENFVNKRAPDIGEDNDEIYLKELKLSQSEIIDLKKRKVI